MIDYHNSPHALLIITSPYYNEKLNEFLLTCDWESLNKKWNKSGDKDRNLGFYNKNVGFIFFEEQPNWREKYQKQIEAGEISSELLEANRPFNVLKEYAHQTFGLVEADRPMFMFLSLESNFNIMGYRKKLIYESPIDMLSNDNFYEQLDSFLEEGFVKQLQYKKQHLRICKIIPFYEYGKMSIGGLQSYISELENDLEAITDEEQKTILQINIDIIKEKFFSGKLSVGLPITEINKKDDIVIVGHVDASFHINRAKDKTMYFYFLMRAKLEQEFISFEQMMEQDLEKLEGIYKVMRDGKKNEANFTLRDRQDFSETVSRINKKIKEKIAEHLKEGYAITAQDQEPKLYGIQAEPDRIKIHKNSSLYWYMKSRVNVI